MNFTLNYPPRIIFGVGRSKELPELLPDHVSGVLMVVGDHFADSGAAAALAASLRPRRVELAIGIKPEPPLSEVDRLVGIGRDVGIDAVVAVGGGSVIDAAKAAAAIIPAGGSVREYFDGERRISGKGLFFAALPTTAGTGAEVTKNAVLTDRGSKIKKSIRHPLMTADLAVVDPSLTLDCPSALTAASGLDALTQAIESFVSLNANPVSRALARDAVGLLFPNLPRVYHAPDGIAARTAMAAGSLLSAMAFSQSGLGAAHGLAHPIGSLLDIPHGLACAVLLVPVCRFNSPEKAADYAELASACGLDGGGPGFIEALDDLVSALDITADFASFGLSEKHFPFIVANCRSNSMKGNPRFMSDEEVKTMLIDLSGGA